MKVVVTGATGMIGAALVRALEDRGDHVVTLSRDPGSAEDRLGENVDAQAWPEPKSSPPPLDALRGADAVVHLLGEPIAQRWSETAKQEIRDSRVLSTRLLVSALRELPDDQRPRVLVSQSATGYYGPRSDTPLPESENPGADFLAEVTKAWEAEAMAARDLPGQRVAVTRTGVVLSLHGGALAKMLPPFRLGIGGPVAGGKQYIPWIHLTDVVRGIVRCLDDQQVDGPVNLTAPEPATNAAFSKALGRVLHRPAVLPIPGFAIRLLYGEMATIVITGQRAVPERLLALGHEFSHPELEPALRSVLGQA
jgi:uncharacterized protein (TIGR01777 family)